MTKQRPLTDNEKARRKRDRMIETARQYTTGTYSTKYVAPVFQRMIRAEAGAKPDGMTPAIIDGVLRHVFARVGQCVCVTCGKVLPWNSGLGGMHTGHFLSSRRLSILYCESNVAPQCSHCNRFESGAPQRFRAWMIAVRGQDVIDRLEKLKTEVRQFTREELVDLKIEYTRRLKAAEARMSQE